MPRKILIGLILLFVFILLQLISIVKGKPQVEKVIFSLPTGESGSIIVNIPLRMWAGDKYPIITRIEFDPSFTPLADSMLAGKLETSVEETLPRGEVRLGLDSNMPVTFEWKVRAARQTIYPGTLWLWLDINGEKRLLISCDFSLRPQLFLGLQISTLRIITGLIILAILLYDFIQLAYMKRNQKT